tara:strand:+ start:2901 stop:3626 length:726 start_codon:yes stop_codon:yes gene_type:complete
MKNIIVILFITLFINSCQPTKENLETKIQLSFSHHVNGSQLSTDSMIHTNAAGEKFNVKTLTYLLSDITLHNEDGSSVLLKEIQYLNINEESSLYFESDIIDNGSYNALSFRFGLDTIKNLSNNYVNENFHSTMAWPEMMGGGYHYMKLEGAFINDSSFYNTHTGGSMGMDFSFSKSIDINGLNIDNDTENIGLMINMDLNNWYQNPHTINLAPAIMMDMTKQMQLMNNGMNDVFSITYLY